MSDLEPVARPVVIRPADPVPAGYTDADFTISAAAAERLITAPAENTLLAHGYDWGNFTAWCEGQRRVPLPATAQTLLDYVTWMMEKPSPSAPASIDRAMGSSAPSTPSTATRTSPASSHPAGCSAPTAASGPTLATGPARQPPSWSTASAP